MNPFKRPGPLAHQTQRRQFFAPIANRPVCSSDKVFIWDALHLVGSAIFGDGWGDVESIALDWPTAPKDGEAFAYKPTRAPAPPSLQVGQRGYTRGSGSSGARIEAVAMPPPRDPSVIAAEAEAEQSLWEKNAAVIERVTRAADWLCARLRDGKIKSYSRFVGLAAEPLDMPASEWFCDDALSLRIRPGQYERWFYSPQLQKGAVYIFVDRATLDAEISTLAHSALRASETDLSALPEPLKLAVAIALRNPDIGSKDAGTREGLAVAAWAERFPDTPSTGYTKAIGQVLGNPDLDRIRREVERVKRQRQGK